MKTDVQVLRDVIAACEQTPGLRFSPLDVDVGSRIVTVRGRIDSHAARADAERTIRGIVGTRALVLKVAIASTSVVHTV